MPEVHFSSWKEPFLPAAVSILDHRFSDGGVWNLKNTLPVLPGARAGRRLMELLVERASSEKLRLVPPERVLTIGQLPEELYQPPRPMASGATARRAWNAALKQVPEEVLLEGLGPLGVHEDSLTRLSFSRVLDGLGRSVGSAGLSFSDVSKECRRGFLFSDEARWQALSRIQTAFRSCLRDAGFMDREEARAHALRRGILPSEKVILLLGVAELPLVTRRMLEAADHNLLVLVHAPDSASDSFDHLGTVRVDVWEEQGTSIPDEILLIRDGPVEQATEVAFQLAGLASEFAPDEVAVGVPDPSVVPYVAQQLDALGYSSRYAEGTSLLISPPVQLLKSVADYLGRRNFESLAALLRHPDLPTFLSPETAPEIADDYFHKHLPALVPDQPWPKGEDRQRLDEILERLNGSDFLGQFGGEDLLSAWMPRILSFLADAYGDLQPASDPLHYRLVMEASVQVRAAAEALSNLPPSLDEVCQAADALRALLTELKDGKIPSEARDSAVEMVGWLELQLDDAPVVLLTGVSDPFLPEAVNADPFLPNALRSRLGLEDNRARYCRDAYRLTALVHSTPILRILASRRSAAGDPLRPSRLLLTGSEQELANRVLTLTGAGPGGKRRRVASVGMGLETRFQLPPEAEIPLPEGPLTLPVTAFRTLLADPYLWALENLRGLRDRDYDPQELDPMSFGNLAHEVLEHFSRSPEAGSKDPEAIGRRLDKILDAISRGTFGSSPLPTVPLQIEQLRTRLHSFADWQAEWAGKGWEILCVEARTPPGGVPFLVDGEPVFLKGRVDRIDAHSETGAWTIFDYKTGEGGADPASARSRDGQWKDLQLPLYRFLLGNLLTSEGAPLPPPPEGIPVDLAYLPIPKDPGAIRERIAAWAPAELAEGEEAAREVIRKLRKARSIAFESPDSGRKAKGELAVLLGKGLLQSRGGDG